MLYAPLFYTIKEVMQRYLVKINNVWRETYIKSEEGINVPLPSFSSLVETMRDEYTAGDVRDFADFLQYNVQDFQETNLW